MGRNSWSLNFPTRSKEDFPDCLSKQTKRLALPRNTSHLDSQDQTKEHLRSQLKCSEALHGKTNPSLLTTRAKKPSCCKLFPWVPMQSFIGLIEMSQAGEQGKRERKDCLLTCLLFLNYHQFLPPPGKKTSQESFPGLYNKWSKCLLLKFSEFTCRSSAIVATMI